MLYIDSVPGRGNPPRALKKKSVLELPHNGQEGLQETAGGQF